MRHAVCCLAALGLLAAIGPGGPIVLAQIPTDIVERHRAALQQQSTDPVMKREGGTQPIDWNYTLPDGVTTRQVTFYVDGGTPLYGKIFFPKGFTTTRRYAAVAVGHGVNALSIGIEKFAARFAERGLVAMAIDYRTYGWSGSDLRLLEPDPTTDATTSSQHVLRIQAKRTNLNNFREVEDFRAAVSFLQGEPGVDPERIGVWGSSNGGAVVVMVAAQDARVKAVVAQVSAVGGIGAKGPVPMRPEHIADAVQRARTGQGAEADGGFSFRSKIDLWGNIINREFRPGSMLHRVPQTTKLLWLPAEHDELIPLAGPSSGLNGPKAFKGIAQATVLPFISHFQAYSYTAFEVGSTLAADWFVKYLVDATPAADARKGKLAADAQKGKLAADARKGKLAADARMGRRAADAQSGKQAADARMGKQAADAQMGKLVADAQSGKQAADARMGKQAADVRMGKLAADAQSGKQAADAMAGAVTRRDVTFFSEDVRCAATLYLPAGFVATGAAPAVVLAPGWGQTARSVASAAGALASRGIVAMAIDYRGWGRSGGFVFPVTAIQTDDRLRFSQHTATVRIQRKRLIPSHQIMDIRNAVSWLQGEPGVDAARIAVWGSGLAAGHAVMVAAVDPRIKALIAESPVVPGEDVNDAAWAPSVELLRDELARVRQQLKGSPDQLNEREARAALAQYQPFHYLDHLPKALPTLFVMTDAAAVASLRARLAGPAEVVTDVAAAAEWLGQR